MTRTKKIICTLLVISVLIAVAVLIILKKNENKQYKATIFTMNTEMEITAYGKESEEAVKSAVNEINRLDALWDINREDSEVALLNKNRSMQVSNDTFSVIKKSIEVSESTDGMFDITVYPVLVLWGFTTEEYNVPDESALQNTLSKVNYKNILLDEDTKRISLIDDAQIELGGIAKGYTSQRVMEIFAEYNVKSGIVSLGGNVETYHKKTDGSLYRVGIRNPDSSIEKLSGADYIGVLSIEDKAAITSGGYERYFEEDGVIYHHIIDPKTGKPANSGLISVTIISSNGTLADGLSTSVYIMGLDAAVDYWRQNKEEFDFVLVDSEGNIYVSDGIESSFTSDLNYEVVS